MTIRPAIENAVRARARGRDLPAPRLPNMEQRQNVQYVSDASRRLPETEIALLAQAAELRERGLALARKREPIEARRLLSKALAIVEQHVPSVEGRAIAHSFHAAVQAYVDHVDGLHNSSCDALVAALVLCRRLRLDYGYRVEVRRVHLARNIVRLTWSLKRHVEAWRICGQLLAYVWGIGMPWPLGEDTSIAPPDRENLKQDERLFLTDQLLSEAIAIALSLRNEREMSELPRWFTEATLPRCLPERALKIESISRWLAAAETLEGLSELTSYFEEGAGDLPTTWHRLDGFLDELVRQLSEDIAGTNVISSDYKTKEGTSAGRQT